MKLGDNGEAFFVQEMEVPDVSIFTKGLLHKQNLFWKLSTYLEFIAALNLHP